MITNLLSLITFLVSQNSQHSQKTSVDNKPENSIVATLQYQILFAIHK